MIYFKNFPLTRYKIYIAKVIYKTFNLFAFKKIRRITRYDINYEIDLAEVIDLMVFIFGSFQKHIFKNKIIKLPKDAVVFDVGANIGVISLGIAKMAERGMVYSFEPTHYAYSKFKKNLELNTNLSNRIKLIQTLVSDENKDNLEMEIYSSWRLDNDSVGKHIHPIHLGTAKSANGISSITLEEFCNKNQITRLDLIKIDTDGHEYKVLKGARESIIKLKPKIIFEIGIYLMNEHNIDFSLYYDFFNSINYDLVDSNKGNIINDKNYTRFIPNNSTTDIIAIPRAN